MTEEDLNQIRQIVDRAIETLAAKQDRAVETLTANQDRASQALTANQDRAIEAIAGEMSALRAELGQRIDGLSQRMDNLAPVIISADSRMAAFTRSMDRLITVHGETEATLGAQQRVMEQLNARIKALEEKATGRQ